MIKVKTKTRDLVGKQLRDAMTSEQWRAFLAEIGEDMVAQVKLNFIKFGGPGRSAWAQLSGFNVRTKSQAKKGGHTSRHSGYAKRKDEGKTPGHGKHGADERLLDTGELYNSLKAKVAVTTTASSVSLFAEGGGGGDRPTNDELLAMHAEGAGNLPKRDPASEDGMEEFQRRMIRKIEKYLDAAARSRTK